MADWLREDMGGLQARGVAASVRGEVADFNLRWAGVARLERCVAVDARSELAQGSVGRI